MQLTNGGSNYINNSFRVSTFYFFNVLRDSSLVGFP